MTPDFILGNTPETTGIPDTGPVRTEDPDLDDVEPGSRVKVYDGLVVDPAGNPGILGADSNGA